MECWLYTAKCRQVSASALCPSDSLEGQVEDSGHEHRQDFRSSQWPGPGLYCSSSAIVAIEFLRALGKLSVGLQSVRKTLCLT